MDLVILNNFFFYLILSQNKDFLTDYFTGSKFRININSNLATLMLPQQQNYIFENRRPQILQFFCQSAAVWRLLMPPSHKRTENEIALKECSGQYSVLIKQHIVTKMKKYVQFTLKNCFFEMPKFLLTFSIFSVDIIIPLFHLLKLPMTSCVYNI